MLPRFFLNTALHTGLLDLPAAAARHAQVLRLRPGAELAVFDGSGGEWLARLHSAQQIEVLEYRGIEREAQQRITLAVGMPANERMDWLVEKATELGAAGIQPLLTQRSVLRLSDDRAQRRVAHWQGIAVAACEQCGRNRLPVIAPIRPLADWLAELGKSRGEAADAQRILLSPNAAPARVLSPPDPARSALVLSGPEGGLSGVEETMARAAGFTAATLGPRVLRADTAPLVALLQLTTHDASSIETTE